LRLQEATAKRLREVWFLLEPERVFQRALAVCAKGAIQDDPPADLPAWVVRKIDLAIEQLVWADREAERARPELLSAEDRTFPLMTTSLMIDPELVRSASVRFNELDPLPRRAFFELCIEGRTVAETIEPGPWNEDGLFDAIHAALGTLGLSDPSLATKK
jgi:hypothetical protein